MAIFALIVLVFGFVFACLAAKGYGAPMQLGWAALACLILYFMVTGGARVIGVH